MSVEGLNLERRDGLATVVLDRANSRNAITLAMWRGLADLFTTMDADSSLRGVVLTGAGDTFSAGADIADFEETRASPQQSIAYEEAVDAACDAISSLGRPVIAAVRGSCYGGACNLAMSCDFRFLAPNARMAIPAAKLSIVYGVRGTARLVSLVGPAEAKRVFLSAKPFDAERALANGFADRVSEDPREAALEELAEMAALAPLTQAGAKAIINMMAMPDRPFDTARAEALIHAATESADYAEGRRAFAEKRPARFEGR